jgi:anti-sigma regulatory factor (Ser/Thr protein kinase)
LSASHEEYYKKYGKLDMAATKTITSFFRPCARLMLQLGDQLIKNEGIALLELVKNSYDADARKVSITMSNIDNPEEGNIIIEDDGIGMDINIIKKVWMEPGSDFKEKLFKERKRSKRFKRLPLGEKGIGRFGAHKLGKVIELVSKMKNKNEVFVSIDWSVFQDSKYLEDVPVKIYQRKAKVFINNTTGTKITIKNLKCKWDRGMVRDIYRSVNSLCSPFSAPSSFKVKLDLYEHQDWLKGLLSFKEIKDYSLYYVRCIIQNNEIKKFTYRFTPWETMTKLQPREVREDDENFQKVKIMVDEDSEPIDLSKHNIGEVRFEAYIFDRASKILSLGIPDKKGFKDYLNQNGGIRVYRDGVRVYDYGEPGNDWLDLGIRRINVPTKRISNNIILGAIHIKRNQSEALVEKANREGFIENEAYHKFCAAILYTIGKVENFRNPDKELVQNFYGATSKSEPVLSSLAKLRVVVEKKVKNKETKKELIKYIDRIQKDYENINETLLKSAGAGLGLSIVIHEMEKIVKELTLVLKKEKSPERTLYLARHLSQLVEGYTFIIRGSGMRSERLGELIDQALFNMEYRLRVHNVNVLMDYDKTLTHPKLLCSKAFVINNTMNLIDNSIWWLRYYSLRYNIKKKKIFISLSEELPGYTSIVIADNGKGFSMPTDEIIKPFISGKPENAGMGIGLHIVNESMKAQKGLFIFPEQGEFTIPDEFKNGAIQALCFKHS